MSDQVQCPNCGGFDTYLSQEPENSNARSCLSWLGALIAAPGCLLLLLICTWANNPADSIRNLSSVGIAIFPILGTILLGIFLFWLAGKIQSNPNLWKCNLCKYEWDTRQKHTIHVRPDLIAQGRQRLAEEQRQADEMRDFIHLHDKYHKK